MTKLEREYVNYCKAHPSKAVEFSMWQDAVSVGYAEGLKAGKYDAMNLWSAVSKALESPDAGSPNWLNYMRNDFVKTFDKGRGDGTA